MIKVLYIFLFSSITLFADPKNIPQIVLDAIKDTECLKMSGVEETNFIRINKNVDVNTAKENGFIVIKKHIIKCDTPKKCSTDVNKLLKLGINNIDLGPYQINYYWQNKRWDDEGDYSKYFAVNDSELRAREILWDLISAYGYSWRTIGRYHHYNDKNKTRNRRYYGYIYKYINGVEAPKILAVKQLAIN